MGHCQNPVECDASGVDVRKNGGVPSKGNNNNKKTVPETEQVVLVSSKQQQQRLCTEFLPSFFFRLATERNGDQFHDMEHEKKSSHHRRTRAQKKKRKRIDPAAVEFVADRIENPVEKLGTRRPMAALSHASIQWHPPIPDNVIGPQSPAHRRTFQIPKLVAPQKRNPEKKNSVKLGNGSLRTIRRGKPNADAGKLGKKNSVNKKPTLMEHAVQVSADRRKRYGGEKEREREKMKTRFKKTQNKSGEN